MDFEKPSLRGVDHNNILRGSLTEFSSESPYCLSHGMESFRILEKAIPRVSDPDEKRLSWLRSQVIGRNVEFETPFGKRRLTYADHTASGRCLRYIENYIIKNVLPSYGNSHTSDSYVGQRTTTMVHEATEYLKKCLGGGENDALIFCGTGTTAAIKRLQEVMGIAIPSTLRDRVLKCLSNEEKWVVFVGPYEHHSNILSWRQSLAEVVEIGLDDNGLLDMEALKLQLNHFQSTNRPMIGSFSACSNVTGIYSDTRALARLLHQYGGFACFDFAASGPYVEIEMRSGEIDGYDAIVLSPHKFIGGPGSPGILLMSKNLYQLKSLPPSTCGGGTDTLYVEEIEQREDAGTPPIIQKIRAALAFWVKQYIGTQLIERREHFFIQKALERLLPNVNIWLLGNTSAPRQALISFLVYTTTCSSSDDTSTEDTRNNMRGLYLWQESGNKRDKPLHGPFVAKLLNDLFGIQARGGCACAGPYGHSLLNVNETRSLAFKSAIQMGYNGVKPGWTRISFPYYMCEEEFEFILAALEFTAIYGQRFLPLYQLNWKTGAWIFKEKEFKETLRGKERHCKSCQSFLAGAMMTPNLQKSTESGDGLIRKYTSYLEAAKHIATILPKFPSQRRIPEDIDLELLPFRV
ncbi:hypothetical protein RJ640_027008 [Escallonia rubra]|uniref:Aminotransferase class V domain-containing protein n=1 Tax=Escallonia rubra TaxID=112253 RepID=A0AA88U4Y7_9ASTE|nr:hypothetical protein RJ640_027008 [Escallonia rubra]